MRKSTSTRSGRRSALAIAVVCALLVSSGVALADSDVEDQVEETQADTLFNFAYDLVNHLLVWNVIPLGGQYDCTLEGGTLTATYGEAGEDGSVAVDGLEDDAGAVTFPATPEDELDEGVEPAEGPGEYSGSDGPCGLSAAEVSGPNGQVNHGMFMKLFNSLFDGPGRGCVVRHLAQSGLGKGPEQVKAGDEVDFVSAEPGDTGIIEFTSAETDCEKGKETLDDEKSNNGQGNGKDEDGGNGNGNGKGKPESPGNSGSAPGKNK